MDGWIDCGVRVSYEVTRSAKGGRQPGILGVQSVGAAVAREKRVMREVVKRNCFQGDARKCILAFMCRCGWGVEGMCMFKYAELTSGHDVTIDFI